MHQPAAKEENSHADVEKLPGTSDVNVWDQGSSRGSSQERVVLFLQEVLAVNRYSPPDRFMCCFHPDHPREEMKQASQYENICSEKLEETVRLLCRSHVTRCRGIFMVFYVF